MSEESFFLPENGSVVVIDDKFEEALPIIRAFARECIPVTFYHGYKPEDLPKIPKQIVRLVIADLQLYEIQTDGATIAKGLLHILSQIIGANNGPYILLVWSKRENLFLSDLEHEISKLSGWLRPAFTVSLEKNSCLRKITRSQNNSDVIEKIVKELSGFDEDDLLNIRRVIETHLEGPEETSFEATDDALAKIESRLKEALTKQGIFHLFIIWENLVKKSGAKLVRGLSELHSLDENWESNMRSILRRMGNAILGQNTADRTGLIRASLSTICSSFSDTLDLEIKEFQFPNDIDYESEYLILLKTDTGIFGLKEAEKNKSFTKDGISLHQPGEDWARVLSNLKKASNEGKANSFQENDLKNCERLLDKYSSIPHALNTQIHIELNPTQDLMPGNVYFIDNLPPEKKEKYLATYFKKFNSAPGQFQFIELEVSPICDYAQTKWKRSRTLPGLIYPSQEDCRSGKNFYTDGPIFSYNNSACRMIFDFHLFNALDKHDAQQREVKFRLKRELLLDIVAQLSAHINRPGIAAIQ